MSSAPQFEMTAGKYRRGIDRVIRGVVTAGGMSVLLVLMLIFFYLLYVALPLLNGASLTQTAETQSTKWQSEPFYLGSLSNDHVLYQLGQDGHIQFVDRQQDMREMHQALISDVRSFAIASGQRVFAYGHNNGAISVFEPIQRERLMDQGQQTNIEVNFPLGEEQLSLDLQQQPIDELFIAMQDNHFMAIGRTQDDRWIGLQRSGHSNEITNHTTWATQRFELPTLGDPDAVIITPDGRFLYVLEDNKLSVWETTAQGVTRREQVNVGSEEAVATSLALLPGASSLLVGTAQYVEQWFDVRDEKGERHLSPIRRFNLKGQGAPILLPDIYRKGFLALQPDGEVGLFYTTSRRPLLQEKLSVPSGAPLSASLSVDGGYLHLAYPEKYIAYQLDNPHPEVTFSSLFEPVWYEGYPEPEFVWQSTAGGNHYEPKLSIVPLIFGTLKAALFAMLISVPLAVSGAIYTAYFMSSRLRAVVKPTVELMEALPTVILGFLAAMWLAPIVEANLAALLMMLLVIPLLCLFVGFMWWLGPVKRGWRLPNGWHAVVLFPVLVLTVALCFQLNDVVELWLFDGDARWFLSREWGLGFDQRNALVVSIAMGVAVVPTVFTIAEDAIYSVPPHLTNGSLALGATHWQTLSRVVLITASPGIFSAIMMGMARAVGETMIVLMATGNTPVMEMNLFQGMRTLAANIAIEMPESEVGSSHFRVLFLSALILFLFTFIFNTLAEVVRQRLRDKYSNL
ncbi:ABC transporter permease subunit [Thaumasiovibrio sp. DFM-14]|uniref:ABC transporter permease subunit n=1 Tax=Thaumasiovibrio sp. DFM-14 TaxID=3384792 RepID=UPI0039A016EA